jgi:hypothetical protein
MLMDWWLPLHALTAFFFAAFALFVYLRPPPPALRPVLVLTQLAAVLWVVGDLAAILSPTLLWEEFSLVVLYTGSIPLVALWWMLSLRFAQTHGVPLDWAKGPVVWGPPLPSRACCGSPFSQTAGTAST